MTKQLFLFHATDYQSYPLGGTLGTIKNYLKYTQLQCVLIGITNDPYTKIGRWQKIKVNEHDYDFLPVAFSRREIIPHKILMLVGTIFFARRIMEKCNDEMFNAMLFINRECYLPIKYLLGSKRKVHVFYKMTEAVNPLTTSGRSVAKIKLFQDIYFKVFIRSLLLGSSIIFSINKQCREFCERVLLREEDKKKIKDVRHYVDYDYLLQLYEDAVYTPDNVKKKFIFWGRLAVVKGLDLMIESFGKLCEEDADVELLIIGDGAERDQLEKLVKELNLVDRIRFLGRRSIREIAALSKNAELFLMSSHSEGIPTSMLEALTFGLPVLATAVGGIPTLVSEGANGYLVKERRIDSYVSGIKKAMKLDREKAAKYSRDLVRDRFSAQSVVKNMDHLMVQAIEES